MYHFPKLLVLYVEATMTFLPSDIPLVLAWHPSRIEAWSPSRSHIESLSFAAVQYGFRRRKRAFRQRNRS